LSPLVQVMQQPSLVFSTLQVPMVRLKLHTTNPLDIQQKLQRLPASMVHRFCNMVHEVTSSHMQWIFTPVAHFSTFMVQRGTITMFGATGLVVGVVEEVRLETAERSIIIAVVMIQIS
jgi:hypothetical protein